MGASHLGAARESVGDLRNARATTTTKTCIHLYSNSHLRNRVRRTTSQIAGDSIHVVRATTSTRTTLTWQLSSKTSQIRLASGLSHCADSHLQITADIQCPLPSGHRSVSARHTVLHHRRCRSRNHSALVIRSRPLRLLCTCHLHGRIRPFRMVLAVKHLQTLVV